MNKTTVEKILANPFYAINIAPVLSKKHKTMITEEEFVKGGVKMIKEIGAEKYLKLVLSNLKGDFVK